MKPGQFKIFTKSGNTVRLIEKSDSQHWRVERVYAASAGKQMICPELALVPCTEQNPDTDSQ